MDAKRQFLRHALATLAYRAQKSLRDAPPDFLLVRAGPTTRSAGQILAHLCDLLDWANATARGISVWHETTVESWPAGVDRFYKTLAMLDEFLASDSPLGAEAEKLFQGPIADALTHVGQLATLRCLAGSPVRGENYFKAQIAIGRVGPNQSEHRHEFD
ncbi:MAG: hypothetical protein ABR964_05465 [Tepidisphaeraceae bacterium]|jgi:hypothetical protein